MALGDCYEAAVKFVMDTCMFSGDCPYTIVHAEVAGQGPLEGTNFGTPMWLIKARAA